MTTRTITAFPSIEAGRTELNQASFERSRPCSVCLSAFAAPKRLELPLEQKLEGGDAGGFSDDRLKRCRILRKIAGSTTNHCRYPATRKPNQVTRKPR